MGGALIIFDIGISENNSETKSMIWRMVYVKIKTIIHIYCPSLLMRVFACILCNLHKLQVFLFTFGNQYLYQSIIY